MNKENSGQKFQHDQVVYDKEGLSYRVVGYSAEGKVMAIREKTEGESISQRESDALNKEGVLAEAESTRSTTEPVYDEGPKEFEEDELSAAAEVNIPWDAELSDENRREQKMKEGNV